MTELAIAAAAFVSTAGSFGIAAFWGVDLGRRRQSQAFGLALAAVVLQALLWLRVGAGLGG